MFLLNVFKTKFFNSENQKIYGQKNCFAFLSWPFFLTFFACQIHTSSPAHAEMVFKTTWKSEATHTAYITTWKSEANCVVYETDWTSDAKGMNNGLWKWTTWKSEADKVVYFTDWKSEANLIVYFTTWRSEANCIP